MAPRPPVADSSFEDEDEVSLISASNPRRSLGSRKNKRVINDDGSDEEINTSQRPKDDVENVDPEAASPVKEGNDHGIAVAHLEPVNGGTDPFTPRKSHQPLADITQRENISSSVTGITDTMQRVSLGTNKPDMIPTSPLLNRSSPARALVHGGSAVKSPVPQPPPVPKQRLVISKLVLNNFKSYAGRQEIGPFHSVS
ncbi:hypothetical protein TRICI_002419 [Trichomonascus ciferrii]|uniref:Uncharacterized protein n=1 Tax=Trichomonascus ciferrii TaxID=44093 RepID=A0A642V6S9_9ASCO|nr:hypothetical protein TRICI_002419 [Trichomonascus ciferrii]